MERNYYIQGTTKKYGASLLHGIQVGIEIWGVTVTRQAAPQETHQNGKDLT
jgi:hypothetical protein